MKQSLFTKYLNDLLNVEQFAGKDFCSNGLLVDATGDPDHKIENVVTGVSLRDALIAKAIEAKADAIVVHHPNGFWNSIKDHRLVDRHGNYMRKLIKAGISLYGYHLPLDFHDTIGNNAVIAGLLKMQVASRFGYADIGVIGKCKITKPLLKSVFPKGVIMVGTVDPNARYTVAVCSGASGSEIEEFGIGKKPCDVFITGEVRESTVIYAQENNIILVIAGHHRSEVFGVRALADLFSRTRGIRRGTFIDIDNPI